MKGIRRKEKPRDICPFFKSRELKQLFNPVGNHQSALVRRKGRWELIESSERKKAERMLREQKIALEQKNIALREIIEQIEIEKNKVKDVLLNNINESLMPILKRIKLKGASRKYIDLLQNHLEGLTSSFSHKLRKKNFKLSPREVEICDFIKSSLTSKEISNLLNISYQTIEKHRKNIRKKLNLTNKDINLTTYLQRR